MFQHDTNMTTSSYYAYCNAWCVTVSTFADMRVNVFFFNSAVRAGIVFG